MFTGPACQQIETGLLGARRRDRRSGREAGHAVGSGGAGGGKWVDPDGLAKLADGLDVDGEQKRRIQNKLLDFALSKLVSGGPPAEMGWAWEGVGGIGGSVL